MSKVFDVVDIQKNSKRGSFIGQIQRPKSVLEVVDQAHPHMFEIPMSMKPTSQYSPPSLQKVSNGTCHIVYFIWFLCITCSFLPFAIGYSRQWEKEHVEFPYACDLFFLSLIAGLPGASIHLFCCSLCFFLRNRLALICSVLSIFSHILTVEYTCGISSRQNVPFYLFAASIYFGVVSQISIFESLKTFGTEWAKRLSSIIFSINIILITTAMVASLITDVFGIELLGTKKIYLQNTPVLLSMLIFFLSTFWTLPPIFTVINAFSSTSL